MFAATDSADPTLIRATPVVPSARSALVSLATRPSCRARVRGGRRVPRVCPALRGPRRIHPRGGNALPRVSDRWEALAGMVRGGAVLAVFVPVLRVPVGGTIPRRPKN
ncbi:hypothetical protein GCM10010483_26190 [Actinokineospora diospyrosa]